MARIVLKNFMASESNGPLQLLVGSVVTVVLTTSFAGLKKWIDDSNMLPDSVEKVLLESLSTQLQVLISVVTGALVALFLPRRKLTEVVVPVERAELDQVGREKNGGADNDLLAKYVRGIETRCAELDTRQSVLRITIIAMLAYALFGMLANVMVIQKTAVAGPVAAQMFSIGCYAVGYMIVGLIVGMVIELVYAKTTEIHALLAALRSSMFVNLCGFILASPYLLISSSRGNAPEFLLFPSIGFVLELFFFRVIFVPVLSGFAALIGFTACKLMRKKKTQNDQAALPSLS